MNTPQQTVSIITRFISISHFFIKANPVNKEIVISTKAGFHKIKKESTHLKGNPYLEAIYRNRMPAML